jgi:hypothetical protein
MSEYNGWTNKETWLVNLWLGDDFAQRSEEGEIITPAFIREMVEEMCSVDDKSVEGGFMADLLNCALGEINYHEIAQHYEPEEREE